MSMDNRFSKCSILNNFYIFVDLEAVLSTDFRVKLTKRMLKEALLHCLETKTLSKISVSELCKEAGVNRTTFYNHYESPTMLLKEIVDDYASKIWDIYYTNRIKQKISLKDAVEACLEYLYSKKEEIKILYSKNAENRIGAFGLEVVNENLRIYRDKLPRTTYDNKDDAYIRAVIAASASYGLIQIWLTTYISKTPKEILNLLVDTFGENFLS